MNRHTPAASVNAEPSTRFAALDALRGVAVLMVVYDHLFAVFGERLAERPFPPVETVRHWFTGPLGIIQDFGWMGVCVFFLISGFVITHAVRRETMRTFAIRRLLRIFPPLAAAVLLTAALDGVAGQSRPWTDYLFGVSLLGYVTVPQIIVLGVAWTLWIEVIFYTLVVVISPLFNSHRPALGVIACGMVCALVVHRAREHGASFFLFAASVAYIPVLLIGSTLYLRRQGLVSFAVALVLVIGNLALFLVGLRTIHTVFLPLDNSYLLSLAYALSLFLLCMDRGAPHGLRWVGDISYSLYLLHGVLGFAVMQQALAAGAGPLSPWLATAASLTAAYAIHRWVERPSIELGRRLTR